MCCNFYTFLCCSVGKMLLKNRRFLRPKNEQIIKTTKPHFVGPEQRKNDRGVRELLAAQPICSEMGQ